MQNLSNLFIFAYNVLLILPTLLTAYCWPMNDQLYTMLRTFGKVRLSEPLSKHTTFKIGGPADYFLVVEDSSKRIDLLKWLDSEAVDYVMLGGGSNMLVRDEGYRGVAIVTKDETYDIKGTTVQTGAGVVTVKLANETVKAGLTGFEWGVGVPGTIGGAVRGNAGAMGREMKDSVKEVEAYIDGDVVRLSNQECGFGYRHSIFKENKGVILRVWLELEKGDAKAGMAQALGVLQFRNKTQPKGFASTGCIFKNVDFESSKTQLLTHFDEQDEKIQQFLRVGKISAGWLVEQAGLKGEKQGKAQVSEVHGNFIVNLGGAAAIDVLTLIEKIKTAVYNTFDIELEEEIQVVG